jgi:hypothetical protein
MGQEWGSAMRAWDNRFLQGIRLVRRGCPPLATTPHSLTKPVYLESEVLFSPAFIHPSPLWGSFLFTNPSFRWMCFFVLMVL